MLALSAMHLASLRPLKREYYKQYYQQHLNKAISDYRRATENLKVEESGQIFAMATLVIIFTLATVSDNALGKGDTSEGTESSVADILSIFTTVKGITTMMADDTPIRRGVINSPYAVCTAGYEVPEAQNAEMPITVQLRYQSLRTSCLNALLPGKQSEIETCRNALEILSKIHQELIFIMSRQDYGPSLDVDPSYLIQWIARVSAEFMTMLRQSNTAALIIVGEFFTLMALLDGTWFAKNIWVNALNAIRKTLKPQELCWLRNIKDCTLLALNANMATNAQLVPEAKSIVELAIRKPTTFVSCWRAMVAICDRMPLTMKLITNHLLAMDEGDLMKVAEWSCNFELETFHNSVSKEVYREEMSQKIGEFCNQGKGNEPTIELLRDRYNISFVHSFPRPKRPEDMKGIWPPRRKRVFLCKEPECGLSATKYTTKKALQQHINEEHTKPREGPLESAQENLALAVGPELHGRELTTGATANLVMPSSIASGPSVPYTVTQDRAQDDKVHLSTISTDPGKRSQPQQITSRGVRDGRIIRPSTTNKRPLREIRAKLSSKEFER
ncbi:C6 transcription factor [Fusarium denticulatum]|uniref:C6 transcription factor n=1 Tax=Fusarium denticulatum TaxID=48507 RepID=A0A8H5WSA2_9HYPO|nr:C6 transcription factor [Fusarium denticulatum]